MITIDDATLAPLEKGYPRLCRSLAHFESLELPPGEHCGSIGTAVVQTGAIARTIHLAAATSKFHLKANGSTEGSLRCNHCRTYFAPSVQAALPAFGSIPRILPDSTHLAD